MGISKLLKVPGALSSRVPGKLECASGAQILEDIREVLLNYPNYPYGGGVSGRAGSIPWEFPWPPARGGVAQ